VKSGKVFILLPGYTTMANADSLGNFEVQLLGCVSFTDFSIIGFNNSTFDQSQPISAQYTGSPVLSVGNITVCNGRDDYLQIIRNKDTFNFHYPEYFNMAAEVTRPDQAKDSARINVFADNNVSDYWEGGFILNHTPFEFTAPGTMDIYLLILSNADSIPSYSPVYPARAFMNITEYGAVGGYISGNYSGKLMRGSDQSDIYDFKISFKMRRTK